ncbi:MAG: peptide chain release factor N(5)-glutamine methyltransferase [Leeuwenhoekiella sp.]
MTVEELRTHFKEPLHGKYEQTEIEFFFYWLAEKLLKMNRVQVSLARKETVPKTTLEAFQSALEQLQRFVPIQYILGETEFYGLKLHVTPDVLIPRPETEELVAWVLEDFDSGENVPESQKILDLCTGSGCIAVALAKNLPQVKVSGIDISAEALKVAETNANINQVKVTFAEADVLQIDDLNENFEVMVSNPPYVRELEKEGISENVKSHEPHLALFVPNEDPLLFYRKIARLALQYLVSGGSVYVEINQYLPEETKAVFENFGFENVILRSDIFNKPRMIKATKP